MANPVPCIYSKIVSDQTRFWNPTYSAGSWRSTLPLANLQHRRLSKVARSTDATTGSTTFDIDLGRVCVVGGLGMFNHNITTAGKYRVRGSIVAGVFTSPVFDTNPSVTANVWAAGVTLETLEGMTPQKLDILATPTFAGYSVRYLRITIDDTANPDTYVQIGRFVVAETYFPTGGINVGYTRSYETATTKTMSRGGAYIVDERPVRRNQLFTFGRIQEVESLTKAYPMLLRLGIAGQAVMVFDTADPYIHFTAYLCTFSKPNPIKWPFSKYLELSLEVTEEL